MTFSELNRIQQKLKSNEKIFNSKNAALSNDNNKITNVLKKQQTVNEQYKDSLLILNSNYYKYICLVLISFLLVFVLIKFSTIKNEQIGGGNMFQKEAMFLFIIIMVALLLSKVLNEYNGYIIVSVISILYIYSKIKLNQ